MNFLILHRFYGTVLNNYRSFQIIRISEYFRKKWIFSLPTGPELITIRLYYFGGVLHSKYTDNNISVHFIIIGDIATKNFLYTVELQKC